MERSDRTEDSWRTGAKPISECLDDWSLGDQRRRDDLFDREERPQRFPPPGWAPTPLSFSINSVSSSDLTMADNLKEVRKKLIK